MSAELVVPLSEDPVPHLYEVPPPRSDPALRPEPAESAEPSDQELVKGILAGDETRFEELYARYGKRIYLYAVKRLGDPFEAEDVTQEVFLQVFRSLSSFEGRSTLLTWLFGIAHNQVCRRFRARNPIVVPMEDDDAIAVASPEPCPDRRIDAARVLEGFEPVLAAQVSDDQRAVFQLRYAESRSTRQIANRLGKSIQAVKISLYRTRRALSRHAPQLSYVLGA